MKFPLVLSLCLVACQAATPDSPVDSPVFDEKEDRGEVARSAAFRDCTRSFTPAPAAGWRHYTSSWIAGLGSPVHGASDVVAQPGATATVSAHLGYGGVLDKDLEDEWVWVFMNDCSAWRYVGYAKSNDDGWASFTLRAPLAAGVYDVRLEVVGDTTTATARLWVLPSGTHVAIFDVDGTLTTSDSELAEEILAGEDPTAYPGAVELTRAEDGRGRIPIYVTGRPWLLANATRAWLTRHGFAQGALRLTSSMSQVVPSNGGVGSYKAAYLASLTAGGVRLDDAFGNATTDIYAYARALVPLARTWIIGDHAGEGGTRPVSGGWTAVAAGIAAEPPITQPF